jgi:hypothetical protein
LFVGPGEKLVLITEAGDAVWVWRKFQDASGQRGINCAVFRNEGPTIASTLIRDAEIIAWRRWPGERLYTYVNPRGVRSMNPGACYKAAGWRECGVTKWNKLLILEKLPPLDARMKTEYGLRMGLTAHETESDSCIPSGESLFPTRSRGSFGSVNTGRHSGIRS